MRRAKQIVFRYNGDPTTEESDLDMDGDKSVPKQGSLIERRGERWKVIQVNMEISAEEPFAVPIYRVSSPTSYDAGRTRLPAWVGWLAASRTRPRTTARH